MLTELAPKKIAHLVMDTLVKENDRKIVEAIDIQYEIKQIDFDIRNEYHDDYDILEELEKEYTGYWEVCNILEDNGYVINFDIYADDFDWSDHLDF